MARERKSTEALKRDAKAVEAPVKTLSSLFTILVAREQARPGAVNLPGSIRRWLRREALEKSQAQWAVWLAPVIEWIGKGQSLQVARN